MNLWIIYEYDVCMGTAFGDDADHAINVWKARVGWTSDRGLFAVKAP